MQRHRISVFVWACIVVCGVACHAYAEEAAAVVSGMARVYDGDSIFFGRIEVRLDAIDAPEHDQACRDKSGHFWPCGITARDALRKMVGARKVQCEIFGMDRYHRLLGICYSNGRDLNAAMVKDGDAIAYRHFSEKYAPQEDEAKAARRGIWQDAGFTEPYYCRHFHAGHTCYAYDFVAREGRVADKPLIGKSRGSGAPQ